MHVSWRAPELSATVSHVRICTMFVSPCRRLRYASGALDHLLQAPPLQFGERPRGHDANRVADARFARFIVGIIFLAAADDPAIERVLRRARHLHHDRLLHLVARYYADQFLPRAARGSGCRSRSFVRHYFFLNSASRRSVLTRANSFLVSRSFFKPSVWPVVSWNRNRKTCSCSSRSAISSSFLLFSRSSSNLAITVLLPASQTASCSAACAPRAALPPWPTPSPHPPFQTSPVLASPQQPSAPVDLCPCPYESRP